MAKGVNLQKACEGLKLPKDREGKKLDRVQKQIQKGIGMLKYPEKTMPAITVPLHYLSRVMAFPPPEAALVLALTAEIAYENRDVGITYGGVGEKRVQLDVRMEVGMDAPPPAELAATADATWGAEDKDVYAYLIMRSGGAVAHGRRNVDAVCDASFDSESIASTKVTHKALYCQAIEQAIGALPVRPTIVGTDSASNLAVARRQGAAANSRHSLRRYHALIQRMADGDIFLAKVATAEMPCDFMTKFVGKEKLRKSLAYATNVANRVGAVAP